MKFRICLALLAPVLCAHAAIAAIQYRVDLVPTLGDPMHPMAINNLGEAVGYTGSNNAFIYSNGSTHPVQGLGGIYGTYATGINDSSLICGYSSRFGNPNQVIFTSQGGTPTALGDGLAYAINNSGQLTGYRNGFDGDRAFVYSGGTFTDLAPLGTAHETLGYAINDNAVVAGVSGSNGFNRPAIFVGSSGHFIGSANGSAWGINNQRQVVGQFDISGHGFVYNDVTNTLIDVAGAQLNDINNNGEAVGTPASIYTPSQGLRDLNALIDPASGWQLFSAVAINDLGQILGSGNLGAFVLTPLPEPATAAVFVIAAAGLFARRARAGE